MRYLRSRFKHIIHTLSQLTGHTRVHNAVCVRSFGRMTSVCAGVAAVVLRSLLDVVVVCTSHSRTMRRGDSGSKVSRSRRHSTGRWTASWRRRSGLCVICAIVKCAFDDRLMHMPLCVPDTHTKHFKCESAMEPNRTGAVRN